MKLEVNFPTPPLTRREVMIKGIAGALAIAGYGSRAGIVLASVPGVTEGETPGLEEGPFWIDGQVERVDVRTNTTSTTVIVGGIPLYLGITVSQLSDSAPYTISPLVGAKVDIWNADGQGVYSAESSESTVGQDYNRGYQITSSHGTIQFLTNYPGWYSGRTPHVHIRIRTYSGTTVIYNWCTQLFFDETVTSEVFASSSAYTRTTVRDSYNATDRVFNGASENGSPETEAGDYTLLKLAEDGTHVIGTMHIVLDLSDTTNDDPTGGTETTGGTGGGTGGGGTAPTGGGGTPPTGTPPAIPTTVTSNTQTATTTTTTNLTAKTKAAIKAAAKAQARAAAKAKAAAARAKRK